MSEEIRKAIARMKDEKVKWMHVQFMDLVGRMRSMSFPAKNFFTEEQWNKPITFDASSCGMASVNFSDMLLKPDPSTLLIYPWSDPTSRTAIIIANIITRNGKPSPLDTRSLAEKVDRHVKDAGFQEMGLGPEMEFYLFHTVREAMLEGDLWHPGVRSGIGTNNLLPSLLAEFNVPEYPPRATSAYLLPDSRDTTSAYRSDLCDQIMALGIPVKYHHHEGGSRQVEIEFSDLSSAVKAGEAITLTKHVSRIVGQWYDLVPTFMPKPLTGDAGSGMHLHVHLFKGNKSAFLDDDKLSQTGRYFVGGILENINDMAIVLNPVVNSYRRLVPGFEAPRYTVWAYSNRSSLVRIPPAKGGKMDVEVRNGDAAANPYMMISCILEAGLEGIKKKIEPGDPVEEDVDHFSPAEVVERGIGQLPSTLGEAIAEAENSDFLKRVLGSEVLDILIDYKRKEWQGYLGYATPWEIFHYFDV